mmetsp:Transcript_52333/g.149991  ORF Transcript_52333/g.149991 Transcript_52333/m.149991 type:complete len:228 (+) Transcript_52333:522-1205(+)
MSTSEPLSSKACPPSSSSVCIGTQPREGMGAGAALSPRHGVAAAAAALLCRLFGKRCGVGTSLMIDSLGNTGSDLATGVSKSTARSPSPELVVAASNWVVQASSSLRRARRDRRRRWVCPRMHCSTKKPAQPPTRACASTSRERRSARQDAGGSGADGAATSSAFFREGIPRAPGWGDRRPNRRFTSCLASSHTAMPAAAAGTPFERLCSFRSLPIFFRSLPIFRGR